MKRASSRVGKILGVLLCMALWARAARAEVITIRLGHVGFPGSLFDISAQEYARRVNAELKGRYEVKVFHSSQLGSDEQLVKGIKLGATEMFEPSTVMSTVEPRFGVFEMPYLITSRAQMKKVAESPVLRKVLFAVLPPKGMRLLGVWENGFRHITNSVRPINKPVDLKGVKLRVPGGTWRLHMFKAYGSDPAPMPFAEVYSALQAGTMDGQENPFAQIASARLQEVQKFLSLSGHVYTPAYLIVSEDFWQKVPADAQAVLSRIAVELGDFSRAQGEALDRDLMSQLAPPLQVNEVDKPAFIQASMPIYQQFALEVPGGGELVKLIESLR